MKKILILLFFLLLIPYYTAYPMSVILEWDSVVVTPPKTIAYYNVYQSPTSGKYTGTSVVVRKVYPPKTTITISGLTNATLYYRITAVDNYGNESSASPELSTRWFMVLTNYSKYGPKYLKYWNTQ